MKRILSFFLTLVLTAALLCPAALAVNETAAKDRDWVYITLDPGHGGDGAGGNDSGAVNEKYGYQEADLVLKIGLYLKEELETYRNGPRGHDALGQLRHALYSPERGEAARGTSRPNNAPTCS